MEVKPINSSTNVTSVNSKSSARRRNPNISWGRSFVGKLREEIETEVRQEYEKRFQAFITGEYEIWQQSTQPRLSQKEYKEQQMKLIQIQYDRLSMYFENDYYSESFSSSSNSKSKSTPI